MTIQAFSWKGYNKFSLEVTNFFFICKSWCDGITNSTVTEFPVQIYLAISSLTLLYYDSLVKYLFHSVQTKAVIRILLILDIWLLFRGSKKPYIKHCIQLKCFQYHISYSGVSKAEASTRCHVSTSRNTGEIQYKPR